MRILTVLENLVLGVSPAGDSQFSRFPTLDEIEESDSGMYLLLCRVLLRCGLLSGFDRCGWGWFLRFEWPCCVCSQTRLCPGPRQQGRQVQGEGYRLPLETRGSGTERAAEGRAGGKREIFPWNGCHWASNSACVISASIKIEIGRPSIILLRVFFALNAIPEVRCVPVIGIGFIIG
jgi:hypothetical protein